MREMHPLNIFIAFGNKLKSIKKTNPSWESFDPETDREFQLLLAGAQKAHQMFERAGLIVEPEYLQTSGQTLEEIKEEIALVVEKYQ